MRIFNGDFFQLPDTDLDVPLRKVADASCVVDGDVIIVAPNHVLVPVQGDIRLRNVVIFVVTVGRPEPLVEAVFQRVILGAVAEVPEIYASGDAVPTEVSKFERQVWFRFGPVGAGCGQCCSNTAFGS